MPWQIKVKAKNQTSFSDVADRLNHPLANLIVQAFDRDMRGEELWEKVLPIKTVNTKSPGRTAS
ncbi:MAG: hypothetical protein HS132_13665 [Planctomycetia bacterium]|nr:hypothetical protein [Planctomycetia bacterium]